MEVLVTRPPQDQRRIKLRVDLLGEAVFRKMLTEHGYDTYDKIAELLGIGVATVHRAFKDDRVGYEFILAARLVLPQVPYDQLFREA